MADFYSTNLLYNGVNHGRVLLQAKGEIGGSRHVFVDLKGDHNGIVYPPIGCYVKNPPKGFFKAFAGDLFQYNPDGTGYILKTYEVADSASATDTTVKIVRNGFRHIPFVGDVIMVAPAKLSTKGKAVTVTAVKKNNDAWELTLSEALGTLSKGSVLVEGESAGASVLPRVTNPNAFFPTDFDFLYEPTEDDDDFDGARYFFTPSLAMGHTCMYIDRMSPLPAAVKAMNKSLVEGWFLF